jgi:threonine dehydratase
MAEATNYCVDVDDVIAAAERIKGIAYRTPVLTSSSLDQLTNGRKIFFKVEAMQRTGSFKFRGALNATKCALSDSPSTSSLSVVTHSSGNHAQALALAAKLASTNETIVTATIVMPRNAPLVKKAAVAAFGGIIVIADNTPEARESEANRVLQDTGGGTCPMAECFDVIESFHSMAY